MNTQVQTQETEKSVPTGSSKSLIGKLAEKFGVDPIKFWDTLKATAFKQRNGQPPTNEQMMALLIVADQYGLNPFTKEIYAFPDQQNGIIPVVGIDGWSRIINQHPQFDGMEFRFAETTIQLVGVDKPIFEWIECVMYRKDRERPTVIREYLDEIYREPFKGVGNNGPYTKNGPWQTHTRRFSRHKVIIQTARIALGYTGIYDEDEADRIINGEVAKPQVAPSIEFESDDGNVATLPKPQNQPELMQDLATADFTDVDAEDAEYVQVEQPGAIETGNVQHEQHVPQANEVVETQFGQIAHKDAAMIRQMIDFTVDTGAWDTTKSSFEERYSGNTLDYAKSELNAAFNIAFADAE
ncbi:hypothetical protein VA249_45390 (plasmid) [Vibrio alfacsensis]|nr:recombinase RecT [Vibrio alfacsensis]BBM67893.1 hypothetical protein VA249_45390 [Vibrio alfacsensis]